MIKYIPKRVFPFNVATVEDWNNQEYCDIVNGVRSQAFDIYTDSLSYYYIYRGYDRCKAEEMALDCAYPTLTGGYSGAISVLISQREGGL